MVSAHGALSVVAGTILYGDLHQLKVWQQY